MEVDVLKKENKSKSAIWAVLGNTPLIILHCMDNATFEVDNAAVRFIIFSSRSRAVCDLIRCRVFHKTEYHLPEIPSEAEVSENGVDVVR